MIREHGLLLMGRDSQSSEFYDLPTPEQVASFNPARGPCCTADRFQVDIRGFPKSAWNISAARVFACSFLKAHPTYKNKKLSEVEKAWTTHVEYLRVVYQKQTSRSQGDNDIDKQKHRRKECRINVRSITPKHHYTYPLQIYYRRLNTAERHFPGDGVMIIKELGIDGMSSDESDHSPGNGLPNYIIRHKHWHSRETTKFLRICDSFHVRYRYKGHWEASAGAWPHLRIPSLKHSTRGPVMQLPVNLYAGDWLNSLDEFQREALQVQSANYNLKLPDTINRQVAICSAVLSHNDSR